MFIINSLGIRQLVGMRPGVVSFGPRPWPGTWGSGFDSIAGAFLVYTIFTDVHGSTWRYCSQAVSVDYVLQWFDSAAGNGPLWPVGQTGGVAFNAYVRAQLVVRKTPFSLGDLVCPPSGP